ncbi:MAG: hypothetical protein LBT01_05365 [Spirochaetaceae bacterium]|jgi:hypothetical protein|nr:hypothetical protein [Spirochaetaceae bacterium]
MNYFTSCKTIADAKTIYTALRVFDEPNIEEHKKDFERILETIMSEAFFAYHKEKDETPDLFTLPTLQHIITKVAYLKCDIEIIGYWIYCFHAENVKSELEQLGFWHSSKHKAHIYSGKKKSRYATKAKLAELRTNNGMIKKAM